MSTEVEEHQHWCKTHHDTHDCSEAGCYGVWYKACPSDKPPVRTKSAMQLEIDGLIVDLTSKVIECQQLRDALGECNVSTGGLSVGLRKIVVAALANLQTEED